ncbi:MAG: hypothetical protein II034_02385, partial [Muribaculaceae bacterium]|nr:hypothetical protein [Muribaculaceae bacterium]
ECDLNGVRQKVPATIELAQSGDLITYKNNLTTVNSDFNIFVKVTVAYGWGTIKTDWIKVPVKATTVAAPRR